MTLQMAADHFPAFGYEVSPAGPVSAHRTATGSNSQETHCSSVPGTTLPSQLLPSIDKHILSSASCAHDQRHS